MYEAEGVKPPERRMETRGTQNAQQTSALVASKAFFKISLFCFIAGEVASFS